MLIEISRAGHHDQGGGTAARFAPTGPLHNRLQGPLITLAEASDLGHSTRFTTGNQTRGQQHRCQPWPALRPTLLTPQPPLPPAAGQQDQQGGQQRSDVAIVFVGAEAGENPTGQQADQQPPPRDRVITETAPAFARLPLALLPAQQHQPRQAHHQQHRTQLLRQKAGVPKPTLQRQRPRIAFAGRRFEHGTVGAPQGGDPVVLQPRQHARQDQPRSRQQLQAPTTTTP